MKVGDLVIRRTKGVEGWRKESATEQRERLGHGIVLTKQLSGDPSHPCITVYYPKAGKIYDIAESLMEVISESR